MLQRGLFFCLVEFSLVSYTLQHKVVSLLEEVDFQSAPKQSWSWQTSTDVLEDCSRLDILPVIQQAPITQHKRGNFEGEGASHCKV